MSNYIIKDDELMHYGVLGMKWGVRRGRSLLKKSKTKEEEDKAVSYLSKHHAKASKKAAKLSKKNTQLQETYDKALYKQGLKAAKLDAKARKQIKKANGWFVSEEKAAKRIQKAEALKLNSDLLKSYVGEVKAKLDANNAKLDIYNRGIKDIDDMLLKKGRKVVG